MRPDALPEDVTYIAPRAVYHPDTCAPLRAAGDSGAIGLWAFGRGTYPGTPIDPDVLPQLRSAGLWEITGEQNWGLGWHRNEGIEITCVTGGRVGFACEETAYDLPAGTITVTRPWQRHRVGLPTVGPSTLCWFILDVGVRRPNQEWIWPEWLPIPQPDLARLTELLRHNEHPVWRASKAVLSAVDRLERTLRGEVSRPIARIATCISEIFIEIGDLLEQQQPELDAYLSSTERTVALFLQGLADRVDEPWTVDDMAHECGLGRTRFVHYCKQAVNLPPLEYLNQLRIAKATELLQGTDLRITDVAARSGFSSSQYFSTVFRRYTGLRPGAVRAGRTLGGATMRAG